jgi:serine/threonine-protein kinase RsbW
MPSGTPSPVEQREFPARLASLTDVAAFIDDFGSRHGVDPGLALKLTLVLEELVTNTIEHGFGGESDAPIRIALTSTRPASVSIAYEDSAPAFDPLAHAAHRPAAVGDPFEARSIGGLGIHLIGQLASMARYARDDERNRLWLTFDSGADSSPV